MNLGIIGAGLIVKDFLTISKDLSEIKLKAIVGTTRSIENLENLSATYGIEKIFTDIDSCLEQDDIDTIYVAIPNNMHYDIVKKALLKGKNVICEKPFTLFYEETKELVELARSKNLILIEAITNQYLDNYLEIKKRVAELGEVRLIEANFSQLSSRYGAFKEGVLAPVFDKTKGGGVLNDLNIYNIHFVVGIFGKPTDVKYYPNIVRDVDTSGILVLQYETFKAVCIAAKDTFNNSYVHIQGDEGLLTMHGGSNEVASYSIKTKDILEENINKNIHAHRMYSEFKKFAEVIVNKDFDFVNEQLEHSLNVMEVLDKAKKSAEL